MSPRSFQDVHQEWVAGKQEIERQATSRFARSKMPPLSAMEWGRIQLWDNRAKINAYNLRMIAEGRCQKDGRPCHSTTPEFVLSIDYTYLCDGKRRAASRFVNFQNPYQFNTKFKFGYTCELYLTEVYDTVRRLARKNNLQLGREGKPLDLLGHFEQEMSTIKNKKTGKKYAKNRGRCRLPYNFAHLAWHDGLPRLTCFNGYEIETFDLQYKTGRTDNSAQFELFIGNAT